MQSSADKLPTIPWEESFGFGVDIPFVKTLGFVLKRFDSGCSELHYQPQPGHHNSHDFVHGGALMTLLDVAMATAARSVQPDMGMVTIDMSTRFMRPAQGALVARGHLKHRTASLAFIEASVFDHAGRECAHAVGTFKYVRRRAHHEGVTVAGPGTD